MALTDDEKRQMIEHVEYEVIMLLGSAAEFVRSTSGTWMIPVRLVLPAR